MLWSCVKTEQKKLRHSHLWLAFLVIPLLPAFMGAANYVNNLELLKSEWYSLWTQHSLFYANFFYAPLIALYCSYLWRLEHLNSNWNVLMTAPVPVRDVFLGKLMVISIKSTDNVRFKYYTRFVQENNRETIHKSLFQNKSSFPTETDLSKGLGCDIIILPLASFA